MTFIRDLSMLIFICHAYDLLCKPYNIAYSVQCTMYNGINIP